MLKLRLMPSPRSICSARSGLRYRQCWRRERADHPCADQRGNSTNLSARPMPCDRNETSSVVCGGRSLPSMISSRMPSGTSPLAPTTGAQGVGGTAGAYRRQCTSDTSAPGRITAMISASRFSPGRVCMDGKKSVLACPQPPHSVNSERLRQNVLGGDDVTQWQPKHSPSRPQFDV